MHSFHCLIVKVCREIDWLVQTPIKHLWVMRDIATRLSEPLVVEIGNETWWPSSPRVRNLLFPPPPIPVSRGCFYPYSDPYGQLTFIRKWSPTLHLFYQCLSVIEILLPIILNLHRNFLYQTQTLLHHEFLFASLCHTCWECTGCSGGRTWRQQGVYTGALLYPIDFQINHCIPKLTGRWSKQDEVSNVID